MNSPNQATIPNTTASDLKTNDWRFIVSGSRTIIGLVSEPTVDCFNGYMMTRAYDYSLQRGFKPNGALMLNRIVTKFEMFEQITLDVPHGIEARLSSFSDSDLEMFAQLITQADNLVPVSMKDQPRIAVPTPSILAVK